MNPTPNSYIPPQARLYFPKDIDRKGTDSQRSIFDGNTQFDSNEHQHINNFKAFAKKQAYTLKPMWSDNMILRFLYANNFKMANTLASVKDHTVWRETCIPVNKDKKLLEFLNSGLLYIHGRDHKFRPIVVFNIYMINPKTIDIELVIRALTFWFEYIIDEWMLPGQIENWVFLVNVKGMGLAALAVQSVRKLFSYLQENYKCRLHALYLLNTPTAIYVPWQIVKKFLDEVTVKKIQFCKAETATNLFTHANRAQVEVRFGGTAPNITQFWPPKVVSNEYFISKDDQNSLVTREQYTTMYRTGKLQCMRVDHSQLTDNDQYLDFHLHELGKLPSTIRGPSIRLPNTSDSIPIVSLHSVKQHSIRTLSELEPMHFGGVPISQRSTASVRVMSYIEEENFDADYADYMDEEVTMGPEERVKEFTAIFIRKLAAY